MRKILLIIILMFFFKAKAQKKPSFLRTDPYKKATLYLRKGDTINGIFKLNSFNEIIFRKEAKAKKKKYNYKTVKGLTVHIDSINRNYEYKTIREEKPGGRTKISHHLLEKKITGKISIYVDDYEAYRSKNLKKNIGYTSYGTDHRFYISKGKTNLVTTLGRITTRWSDLLEIGSETTLMGPNGVLEAGGKLLDFKLFYTNTVYGINDLDIKLKSKFFKKIVERYFSDCEELVSRIESGFYQKNEMLLILNYYNKDCKK